MKYIIYFGIIFLTFSFIPLVEEKCIGLSIFILTFIFFRYFRCFRLRFIIYCMVSFVFIFIQFLFLFFEQSSVFSFFQFFVFCFFISFAVGYDFDFHVKKKILFFINSACYFSLITLFFLAFTQLIEFHFFGSHKFIDLLSHPQLYSNSYIIKQIDQGYFRAVGCYFEPSFLALVASVLWCILFCSGKANKKEDIFLISIMLMSKSSLGIFTACFLLFFKYFFNKKYQVFSVGFCVGIIFLPIVFYLGEPLFLRLKELNVEGSSGYYRMIAPIFLIDSILFDKLLPIPLGDIGTYMSTFGILNGEQVGVSIDNGYYVLLAHFSWIGVIFSVCFFCKMIFEFKKNLMLGENKYLAYLLFLIMPLYTGAVFSPEFIFVNVILIFSVRFQSDMV